MAIDIVGNQSPGQRASSSAVSQLAQQRQEALQGTLRAMNLKVGDTVEALVRSASPADQQLRAKLSQWVMPSNQNQESAATRNGTATGAQMKGDGSLATNLMQLLKSPQLKLIEVQIRQQSLVIFTDQALKTGQTVQLQLHDKGFMLLSGKTTGGAPNTPVSQEMIHTSAGHHKNQLLPAQMQTLTQALRTLMPAFSETNHPAHKALADVMQAALQLNHPSAPTQLQQLRQQLPPNVADSLRQAATLIRSPLQLTQVETLKHTLKNAGQFMEQQWIQSLNSAANKNSPLLSPPANDTKGSLVKILQTLNQTLSATQTASTTQSLTQSLQQFSLSSPPLLLSEWLRLVLQKSTAAQTGPASSRADALSSQLQTQLHQQVQVAIAKILFDQLQSLQKSQPFSESSPNNNHWQLEIPMRFGADVYPLALRIEEDWEQNYQEDSSNQPQQLQKWVVKMTFELPHAGKMHAHVSVLQTQVSTTLWVENAAIFPLAQNQLRTLHQRLEKDGCTVKSLECLQGKPQEEKTQIHYSLVDIRT